MKDKLMELVKLASVAALYVVLTPLTNYLTIGTFQVRVAEFLVLLCFFNKKYIIPLTLGCLVSNLIFYTNSLDLIFGTLGTLSGCLLMLTTKNIYVASIYPSITNGILITLEYCLITNIFTFEVISFNLLVIIIAEFVSVSVIGIIIMKLLIKNKKIVEILDLKGVEPWENQNNN